MRSRETSITLISCCNNNKKINRRRSGKRKTNNTTRVKSLEIGRWFPAGLLGDSFVSSIVVSFSIYSFGLCVTTNICNYSSVASKRLGPTKNICSKSLVERHTEIRCRHKERLSCQPSNCSCWRMEHNQRG